VDLLPRRNSAHARHARPRRLVAKLSCRSDLSVLN
jgi:hypothetical protein